MTELITNYSWSEIVLFVIAFSAAIKGVVTFWDWGKDRLKKVYDKEESNEIFRYSLLYHILFLIYLFPNPRMSLLLLLQQKKQ